MKMSYLLKVFTSISFAKCPVKHIYTLQAYILKFCLSMLYRRHAKLHTSPG